MRGGLIYSLDELAGAPEPPVAPSGIGALDAVFPGIAAGAVCAIIGMRGVGVTALAMTYTRRFAAREAENPARAVFMNGHLPANVLAQRLATEQVEASGVSVASWLALPGRDTTGTWDWVDSTVARAGLVVYDTVDESFPALREHVARRERVWAMRDLRDAARTSSKAVIATCRVAPTSPSLVDVSTSWLSHPMHEAVMDAVDIVITLADSPDPNHVRLVIDSRITSRCSVDLRIDPRTRTLSRSAVSDS